MLKITPRTKRKAFKPSPCSIESSSSKSKRAAQYRLSYILVDFFSLLGRSPRPTGFTITNMPICVLKRCAILVASCSASAPGSFSTKRVTRSLPFMWSIITWYSLDAPSIPLRSSSIWLGKILTPLTLTISSVRPRIVPIRGYLWRYNLNCNDVCDNVIKTATL